MIEFNSQNEFSLDNPKAHSQWIINIAEEEGFEIDGLSYVFCSDEFLLDLNMKYLDHDTLTDIITFDYSTGQLLNGEIYISTDRVLENAGQFNVAFEMELHRVMAHGILHLCGFKDKSDVEKKTMRGKEDYYVDLYSA
ncbi:MAG: rRNA maturation RNase YbeY [Leeuwenhoekiella sp.]